MDNYNILAQIGKGNFATVVLAETKDSKGLRAIKILRKDFLVENNETNLPHREKRMLLTAEEYAYPFIIRLHSTFQSDTSLCFMLEYAAGGDLMFHMQKGKLGIQRARLYAAEVCLALKFFHQNNIIYRNLQADNVLLSLDGHIKLVGFGFAKELRDPNGSTETFCGTAEFMAPEILRDRLYGFPVDWWAFGVLLYQMLTNQSPFRGEDEDEIYDAILSEDPAYAADMPEDALPVILGLLGKDPAERLGSDGGFDEVKRQRFFSNVDWEAVYEKRITPCYIPQIQSTTDTCDFDAELTNMKSALEFPNNVLSSEQQQLFEGFSSQILRR